MPVSASLSAPAALLFDLDGTLVDSVPDLAVALNTTLREDGRRSLSDQEVAGMVGKGISVLVERAYAATGTPVEGATRDAIVQRYAVHYNKAPLERTTVFPGVLETLALLAQRGHPMAVCTNKPQAPAEAVVKGLGLGAYFQAIFGAGSVPRLKPEPDMLYAALRLLDHSGPAVMIGDSINDSAAAQAAHLPCVCVTFGYRSCSPEELGADQLIDRFADLPQAIAKVIKPL